MIGYMREEIKEEKKYEESDKDRANLDLVPLLALNIIRSASKHILIPLENSIQDGVR